MAVSKCFLGSYTVLALASFACSSSDSSGAGDDESGGGSGSSRRDGGSNASSGGGNSSSSTGGGGDEPVDDRPVGDDLTLLFNPMYSAYDGDVHEFRLPAIVQRVQDVEWSARPADAVDLEQDTETGGVMITTRKAGDVQIIARAGVLSGSAMLHITDATPEDWELGEQRYNNEIAFPEPPDGGFMIPDGGFQGGLPEGGTGFMLPDNLSCRNCHGSSAQALDVEHTPQQTGGYSDEDLIAIFTMGMKPANAKFRTPFPESIYTRFHTWEATEAEKKGIVVYMRSLTPKTQGVLDFMGLREAFGAPTMPAAP